MKPQSAPNSARRKRSRGMTLLELLLVMGVMGIVMGLGVGAFASLDAGRGTAVETVRGALRSAVNSARSRSAAAVVRIDEKAGSLTPRGLVVVGTWHFEEPDLRGAFGIRGSGVGTRLSEGFIGSSLEFPRGGDTRAEFDVERDPSFEFSEGFAVECLIAPDGSRSAHVISVGHAFGIYVLSTGAVRAWFISANAQGEPAGEVVLDSEAALLLPGRWTRVRAEYDRRKLVLWVEGIRVAQLAATEAVVGLRAPLTLGGGPNPFIGRIDCLVLSAWEAGNRRSLPEYVTFEAGVPAEIWFDAAGHLDAARHAQPLQLELVFEGGEREQVWVGKWGTVE